jgi:surface antigen
MKARASERAYTGAPDACLRSCTAIALARRLCAAILLAGAAIGSSGCSYQLGALTGKNTAKPELTAAATPVSTSASDASKTSEGDLIIAKAAAADMLAKGRKDASVPWENPRTGARGTVTPLASAYSQDGFQCQDFLASYVKGEQESWYQGGACRIHGGRWQVRDIRPLQRT